MKTIYFNIQPGQSGGPSIWTSKISGALRKRGHKVIFDKANRADVAMCVISVGKVLKKVNRDKTRVILRCNGIYQEEYNKKFNRAVREDMIALHNDLCKNIPLVNHVVFQSKWSRDSIFNEIVERKGPYSIIPNGCDTNLFKPIPTPESGFLDLIHCGVMRDAYLMETLIGTYLELKKNHKVRLLLAGGMDGACASVYGKHSSDKNIVRLGAFPNSKLPEAYNKAQVFIDCRQGSSSPNVVAEAQACGIPVVTASWGGSCELIQDGSTGVIVDGGRWDYNEAYIKNLANGVEKILNEGLKDYQIRARKHAVKHLGLDTMVNKYLKAMGI